MAATSSASNSSDSVVKPTRSANRTVTIRRSSASSDCIVRSYGRCITGTNRSRDDEGRQHVITGCLFAADVKQVVVLDVGRSVRIGNVWRGRRISEVDRELAVTVIYPALDSGSCLSVVRRPDGRGVPAE